MKFAYKLLLLSIGLLLSGLSPLQAQQEGGIRPDPRLYQALPREYVDALSAQPRLLLYYNFYLENAYFVSEPEGKSPQGTDIYTVRLRDAEGNPTESYFSEDISKFYPAAFNPLKYDFITHPDHYTHYLLGNTGKVLVFLSHKALAEKYENYLRSFKLETAK